MTDEEWDKQEPAWVRTPWSSPEELQEREERLMREYGMDQFEAHRRAYGPYGQEHQRLMSEVDREEDDSLPGFKVRVGGDGGPDDYADEQDLYFLRDRILDKVVRGIAREGGSPFVLAGKRLRQEEERMMRHGGLGISIILDIQGMIQKGRFPEGTTHKMVIAAIDRHNDRVQWEKDNPYVMMDEKDLRESRAELRKWWGQGEEQEETNQQEEKP